VLAVIGSQWTEILGPDGKPRILDEHDWVRVEIAKALTRPVPLIPVWVTQVRMLQARELPPELLPLRFINAVKVEPGTQFNAGMAQLVARIEAMTDLRADNYRTLVRDCRRLGMVSASYGVLSTDAVVDETIRDAKQLLAVMNDGRGFLDSKQEDIRARNDDPTKSTRFVFLHPRSDYLHSLIKKNGKSHEGQVGDIRRGFEALCETPDRKSAIEIRGSYGVFPSSYLISERYAFVSPYLCAEGGSLPIFRFAENRENNQRLYKKIADDAEKVFATAEILSAADFQSR